MQASLWKLIPTVTQGQVCQAKLMLRRWHICAILSHCNNDERKGRCSSLYNMSDYSVSNLRALKAVARDNTVSVSLWRALLFHPLVSRKTGGHNFLRLSRQTFSVRDYHMYSFAVSNTYLKDSGAISAHVNLMSYCVLVDPLRPAIGHRTMQEVYMKWALCRFP